MTAEKMNVTEIKRGRKLGEILVDAGFVKPQVIDTALNKQKSNDNAIGCILKDMQAIEKDELDAALSIQNSLSSREKIIYLAAGSREVIGELLMQVGRINREQLDVFLKEQDETGEMLGSILIRHGLLNSTELESLLAYQSEQMDLANNNSPLRLGNLMLTTGKLTSDQLDSAVSRQQQTNQKLGEVLIDMGYAKPTEVSRGLKIQRHLVTATLSALLCLGVIVESPSAHAADVSVSVSSGMVATASTAMTKMSTDALFKKGIACQEGKGVKRDIDKAIDLLTRAAERGHVDAQYALGVLLEDNEKSMFWLDEAASRGHEQAAFAYTQLASFDYGVGC